MYNLQFFLSENCSPWYFTLRVIIKPCLWAQYSLFDPKNKNVDSFIASMMIEVKDI